MLLHGRLQRRRQGADSPRCGEDWSMGLSRAPSLGRRKLVALHLATRIVCSQSGVLFMNKEGTAKFLKCCSEVDLVVSVDGSGSSAEAGWVASKMLVDKLIRHLSGGADKVMVAVQLLSGPTTWSSYEKCIGKVSGVRTAASSGSLVFPARRRGLHQGQGDGAPSSDHADVGGRSPSS